MKHLFILFFGYVVSASTIANRQVFESDVCQDGVQTHNELACCLCPAGFFVEHFCSRDKNTTCKPCEVGLYNDQANLQGSCEICDSCDSKINLEEEDRCTPIQNRKCRCQQGSYCKDGNCKSCYPCTKCEGLGFEEPCTATSDAICKKARGIRFCLYIPLIIFVILIIVLWTQRKRPAPENSKSDLPDCEDPEKLILLEVDLSPRLYDILDYLGLEVIKELATRKGIKPAKIEMHLNDHPNNTREQSYNILKEWNELQGLQAFPALLTELRNMGKKRTADSLERKFLAIVRNLEINQ